jgi:Domain of unknown function (DUF3459)
MNELYFGASRTAEGTSFRLWAPAAKRIDLHLEEHSYPLRRGADGCEVINHAAYPWRATNCDARAADNGLLTARWRLGDGATLRLTANLSAGVIACERREPTETFIRGGQASDTIPPWSVFWRIGGR